ncbi:MAG: matrixin family metalloprotease [Acidobacteria bacterium]|nr:matrixin family metalloprotease [Acidobacteriota bacterium]
MRRALLLCAALLTLQATAALEGYQIYGVQVDGRLVELKWGSQPVRYYVTNRGVPGVSPDDLRGAAARAFASWQGAARSAASAEFVAFTSAEPFDDDGRVTLGFLSRPDLDRVLGATSFLVDRVTGEIVESDIFFNAAFPWSVAANGESGRFDLESIVLHETGHLFGLGHSALGETELGAGGRRVIAAETVMFPIAFSAGTTTARTPRPDDEAGLSRLYPDAGAEGETGTISGRVARDGRGVLGAHVVAFNPKAGVLVGGLTSSDDGRFVIGGLDPGAYILRVEPLDDADVESFFDSPAEVDVGFRVAYHEALVLVPKGGGARAIEIEVVAK